MLPVAVNLFCIRSLISALPIEVYPVARRAADSSREQDRPSFSIVALEPVRPALITELHVPEVDPPIHENVPAVGS